MTMGTGYTKRATAMLVPDQSNAMRLALILLLYLPLASGFATVKSPRAPDVRLRLASDKNDQPNGCDEGSSERKRRNRLKRCVDYPSFAYDARGRYEVMRSGVSSDPASDGVATFKTPCEDPRTISMPDKRPKKNNSLLDRIMIAVASPDSLEFTQVSKSAVRTRLLNDRCYAQKGPFEAANIAAPPSLADLSPPPAKPLDKLWISSPFRVLTFILAFFSLPIITELLDSYVVTMAPEQLDEITSKFGPGISILYGTFISLTLSILYNRQQAIQSIVSQEASLITMMIRNLLCLLKDDKELAILAGQCAADQIRTLVRGSRGGELMCMIYSDPYDRMMELIDLRENDLIAKGQTDLGGKGGLISLCRDTLKDMNKLRATRLSDEALALPPTHFVILSLLTSLILLGYTISILPTVDANGTPSLESSLLFGTLCTVYVLFYNFTSDLNNPFQGVYQLRRSSIASHLLEAKWLIANHPLLRGEVDFEDVEEEPNGDVLIRSPGLGEFVFGKGDIFPIVDTSDAEIDTQ